MKEIDFRLGDKIIRNRIRREKKNYTKILPIAAVCRFGLRVLVKKSARFSDVATHSKII